LFAITFVNAYEMSRLWMIFFALRASYASRRKPKMTQPKKIQRPMLKSTVTQPSGSVQLSKMSFDQLCVVTIVMAENTSET
jgi:hypothetical protein